MLSRLKRLLLSPVIDLLMPILAVLSALLVGAIMLLILGANPLEAYGALLDGAFGSLNSISAFIWSLVKPRLWASGLGDSTKTYTPFSPTSAVL